MRTGEELALSAMKKEHSRRQKIASRKKSTCDEAINCGSNLLEIYKQADLLIQSGDHSPEGISKMKNLADEEKRLKNLLKMDIVKLMDNQINAEIERDNLGREISMIEFRLNRRK